MYQVESNRYVQRPLPENWPEFPKVMMEIGMIELRQAWEQRIFLENEALVLLCYKKPRRQQGHLSRERARWVAI